MKLNQQDVELWNKEVSEATRRALRHACTIEWMQEEAINKLNVYWLEPNTSFSIKNDHDSTFDFPMTTKAFLFWWFDQVLNALLSNTVKNKKLFRFYATYLKSQYDIWTLKRVSGLKVGKPFKADEYMNVSFTTRRVLIMTCLTLLSLMFHWWIHMTRLLCSIFYLENHSSMIQSYNTSK